MARILALENSTGAVSKELADSPAFQEFVAREYPQQAGGMARPDRASYVHQVNGSIACAGGFKRLRFPAA